MAVGGLFLLSFLAATLLPLSSEATLATLLAAGQPPLLLFAAASAGNILGAVVNWGLGRYALRWQHARWFPFSPESLHKAQARFARVGAPVLLLAWVPVIGDPLTFAAGVLGVSFPLFLLLVAIGKMARYAVILGLFTP